MLQPASSGVGPPGALKICVLTDEEYIPFTPKYYLEEYTWELYFLNVSNSAPIVQELVKRDFDIFMNLCDSSWNEPYPGPEVIQALEESGVAFTGADSAFYDPSREEMKRVCRLYGLLTPRGCEVHREADIEQVPAELCFPMIVKIPNSFGSTGIVPGSRVETKQDLYDQTVRVMKEFGGALIEEFIEGREFTILVAENPDDPFQPKVYPPIEFVFPAGETFKHEALKWVDWEKMKAEPCRDASLSARLMDVGRKLFVGLNGVSYGRCDVRVNAAGEIYVLEINPNCGIFYAPYEPGSADFVLMNDPEGHQGFVRLIFRAALSRQKRLRRSYAVRYVPERGYSLFAQRAIQPGEVIAALEKRPHTLVSLQHVLNTWDPERQEIFFRHAYPITEEIWVTLRDDPMEWTPINHACDPNAWWSGLDIVARRPIGEGEEITLDYATYHDERMPAFACACASPECRETIRGSDYLLPSMDRYAGHVSDFIQRKRKQAGGAKHLDGR